MIKWGGLQLKHAAKTQTQMAAYVRQMDERIRQLTQNRERILQEIKEMQERREILSWDEIAAAVAYPKETSDQERTNGGSPDGYKLLHQAERINKIYISQMEDLFAELEDVELQISEDKNVSRCISRLSKEDKDIIEKFVRPDLTYEKGAYIFHTSRSSLYRQQKSVIEKLTALYNSNET